MKTLFRYLFAVLAITTMSISCSEKEVVEQNKPSGQDKPAEELKPVIKAESEVFLSSYSAEYSLSYIIENPSEEGVLSVETDAVWINNIIISPDTFSFKALENTSGNERTAYLTLKYPGADTVLVKAVQEYAVAESAEDLSASGTSNCYIVSSKGFYKFPAVKGNSSDYLAGVSSVEVLWESFGTEATPVSGDIIASVSYSANEVSFKTADIFREGNALIAVRDASGKILWSWHIWVTDKPEDQIYANGAGTMMDRNLGATSVSVEDPCANGLYYQWGRKDPFMGSSSITEGIAAKSTLQWPEAVESDASCGTIEYSVEHPATYIFANSNNLDWYYSKDYSTDNNRWKKEEKTIYDPCPAGYRVPAGGDDGIWSKAFGTTYAINDYADKKGFDFGKSGDCIYKLTETSDVCWYPAAGYIDDGSFYMNTCWLWSCTTSSGAPKYSRYAQHFYFYIAKGGSSSITPSSRNTRATGASVRCVKD